VHTEEKYKGTHLAAKYQIIKAYQEINVSSNNKICMHYSLSSALLYSHYSHTYNPSYSFRYTIHST